MTRVEYVDLAMLMRHMNGLVHDGISEAMTAEDEDWGEDRMIPAAESVRTGSAANVLSAIFAAADRFTSDAPQHDDMTLLVIQLG